MNNLTFAQLHKLNTKRCESYYYDIGYWSPNDWIIAIYDEVDKAADRLKTLYKFEDKEVNFQDVGKELANIVIYLDLLATRLGLDLGQEVINKFNQIGCKDKL